MRAVQVCTKATTAGDKIYLVTFHKLNSESVHPLQAAGPTLRDGPKPALLYGSQYFW